MRKKPTLCRYDNELRSAKCTRENEKKNWIETANKSKSLHKTMMKINLRTEIFAKSTENDKKMKKTTRTETNFKQL